MSPDPAVVHITPYNGQWRIRRQGTSRTIAIVKDQNTAILRATKINSVNRIVVHKKDGTVQEHISVRQ